MNASETRDDPDGTATGTIIDDEVSMSIAATMPTKAEGNSGTKPFTLNVTRQAHQKDVT